MKIKFRQSGGIAGQIEGVDLEDTAMPEPDVKKLKELIATCGIRSDSEQFSEAARDQLSYLIEIDDEYGKRQLSFDELSVPKSCEGLIEFLRKRSRWLPLD